MSAEHSAADAGTVPTIELDDVCVSFTSGIGAGRREVRAMSHVSFSVTPGQTLGLVGESGSGKTTTGAVVLGLQRPDSGSVRFQGAPLARSLRSRAGRMQAVLQHPRWALDPRSTVLSSVLEPVLVHERRSAATEQRALAMLESVGLPASFATRRPHQLSGGQLQRVSVARALVTHPAFIVFDEAVSALDVSVQAQILNLIQDLQAEHGFAALFISHDLAAVRYISHHVAVMRAGEIVEHAPTEVFYDLPTHPYSRQLFQELSS
ncbi:ATP-binding cassette domain-containing protein [Microbacterium oxydans]|uniref:Oligopeptide transport ATP-binding protein OppF n=1 Tax=Microbacterium oxydans TaxID=82380 RepID=A0A0F0L864_9MICO|nr:ATP-binding cassette domain-containing protein [Microbacterium oxydans]KJL29387.1 Oligopeptide transport ATP-binding protein OppF [Microbacterium oxydans]